MAFRKIFNFAFQSTFKMNNETEYLGQLADIRRMMEKSTKFVSLSGFSGIIIGCYALVATWLTGRLLVQQQDNAVGEIIVLGAVVLVLSLATALYLTYRRSKKMNQPFMGPGSKQLFSALVIPLVTGGVLAMILIVGEVYWMVAPVLLLFYGLAISGASRFSHPELLYMGLSQVILGLLAAWLPQYGLIFWGAGFGMIHILYGTWMYLKYERNGKNLSA